MKKQKITPFIWYNDNAEEAVQFYTSIFKNSKVLSTSRYGDAGPGPKGSVMIMSFELEGIEYIAMNGGPLFKLNESFSMFVNCDTQDEIDYYWEKLSAGGEKSRCGWLKDKFGLSWQVAPGMISEWMSSKDPEKSKRVMNELMKMDKLDIRKLQEAFEGKPVASH